MAGGWRAAAVVVAIVGLVAASLAFASGSTAGRATLGHPMAGHLRLPFGLEPSAIAVEAGSLLMGGEIIGHFEGARGSKRLRNAAVAEASIRAPPR